MVVDGKVGRWGEERRRDGKREGRAKVARVARGRTGEGGGGGGGGAGDSYADHALVCPCAGDRVARPHAIARVVDDPCWSGASIAGLLTHKLEQDGIPDPFLEGEGLIFTCPGRGRMG